MREQASNSGEEADPRFGLSFEQREILHQASRFAEKELHPLQQRMDDEEWWPPHVMPTLGRMGFLGVTMPARFGGVDSDFFASGLITQGLARWNPSVALSYIAHENLCANNIARNADVCRVSTADSSSRPSSTCIVWFIDPLLHLFSAPPRVRLSVGDVVPFLPLTAPAPGLLV
ncbi:MAG: acyl-CoA dehydrogenase family protein [Pseudomonadota bacterium]|nr:acyl-CoA dehydrogenase family protein [Pseudomonadota bacterium]